MRHPHEARRRLCAVAVAAGILTALAAGPVSADTGAKPDPTPLIDARRQGHSWQNSYAFALASLYSYRHEVKDLPGATWLDRYDRKFAELGLDAVAFISRKERGADTQVVISASDDVLLVSFAGSEMPWEEGGIRDWVSTDFRAWWHKPDWQRPNPHCKAYRVHKGFDTAVDVVYAELRDTVRTHLTPRRKLWITGHSLGGALANIAALRLRLDGFAIQGVHTYGAPRVGNACFTKVYRPLEARTQRWLAAHDPVPRTPPFPYEGVGQNNVLRGGDVDLDAKIGPLVIAIPPDHMITAYVNRIYERMPARTRAGMPLPPKLEKKEERQEKREARKEERQEKREARKDAREERRQERREGP
jgi:triacylglycerol lipase